MSSRHNQPVGAGGNLPSHALHPLARAVRLALVPGVVLGLGPQVAVAGPTGGQVRAGQAAITQGPGVTTINQQSARAAIDWQSFNVAKHETVQFNQPGARAATLNRIFDQKPSEIFGQVKANGQVVLMNPNGVFFKPGARVNVGSLVAGAMQVGIDDFMRGSYSLQALKEAGGRVVNQGHIEASDGDVALVGTSVANEGVIVATAGRVQLAAGEKVTVDFEGDGLLRFTVDEAVLENARAIDDQVANSGQIVAEGGDVLITASAADGVFKNSINNSGVIRAGRIENAGGKVRLVGLGPSSSVLNTGQIDASAADATSDGGTVQVTAATIVNTGTIAADASGGDAGAVELTAAAAVTLDQQGVVSARSAAGEGGRVVVTGRAVALNRAAAIDASGGQGGGEILVGGDAHGANPDVANAETTFVSSQATLTADATVDGGGGKVVVWADDTTQYHGKTTAKGGSQDGDGGFVEVSGKDTLVMRGDVDVTAAAGETGTLLLDPATLTIIDAAAGGDHDGGLPTIASGDGDIAGNTVSWGAIDALAATANVVLEATGLVTVDTVTGAAGAGITSAGLVELDLTTGSLTIRSTAGNVVFTTQTDVIRTEGGAITIDASAGTATVGGFNTTGAGGAQAGAVTILSGTGGSFGAVTTGGGTLTLNVGAGTMSQSGATSISGTTVLDKQGAGTLVLGNANTFTGTATINGGTLEVQGGSALADTVEVTLADAAGVNLAVTNSETIGALNGGGATGGDVSIAAGQVLATGDAGDDTFAGVISGATGGLTKQGAGKLTLTGTNTYGGTTTIAGGVLSVSADANLGAAPGAATPAQLEFIGGTLEATATFTLDANRGVALTGAGTFDVDTGQVLSYAGVIAGSGGGLTKADIGTLVLSGANTYTTSTNIAAGVLNVRNDTALGSAVAGTAVASGAALELQGDITIGTEALLISGSGVGGNGALRNISGSNSIAGAAILLGATTIQSDAGTLTYGGGISGAHDLVVEGAGNTTLSGAVTTATGTLTKNDGGTLLLSGANTFTGLTTVNGGTLEVQGGAALADTVEVTLADAAGANLKVTNSETLGALNGGGATGGDVSIGAGQVLTTGDAGDDTFAGVISGATGALIKQGAGKLTLTGTNTYGGATTINGGVLSVSADANLGAAPGAATPGHLVFNNGTLEATATFTLNANRGVALNGAGTFDVDTGQVLTYAGIIAGSGGGLSKADAGTLVLGGVNTYDTATTLAGGVLSVSADANLGAAPVGATAGHLTFNGGTLEATATFTLNGNRGVALAGAGTFDVDTGQVLTYAGVIAGSGGALNKADTGTLVMTGANTYTTATNVNAGVLNIQNAAALGTTGVGTTVASGAALELQGDIALGAETLSLAGSGVGGNGALRNVSGANSLAGAVTLAAATTVQSDAGSLTLSGGIGGAGQDLTIEGAGDTTVDSAIGTATGTLTKNDAGTLLLSGTNT
ncbi:MAG: autotransporter-associated beta strand repeat-containing protein, partial [Gammaproteobacteria bacterium]|nr:autotransporter-associated beta strand repeat-containing protein [Gammaproteobacteria bacterium]